MYQAKYRATGRATIDGVTNLPIPKPVGLVVGDAMLAHITNSIETGGGYTEEPVSVTTPAGWTLLDSTAGTGSLGKVRGRLYWKLADAADVAAATFTFVMGGTAPAMGSIAAFYDTHLTAPFAIVASGGTAATTTTSVSVAGGTPTYATGLLAIVLSTSEHATNQLTSAQAVATDNPAWTEVYDSAQDAGNPDIRFHGQSMAYAERPSVAATGNITATHVDNGIYALQLVAIQPVPPAAIPMPITVGSPYEVPVTYDAFGFTITAAAVVFVPSTNPITNEEKHVMAVTNVDKT